MKRTINRVLARLAMFLIAIILGAIAVAQAQRGFDANRQATAQTPDSATPEVASLAPSTSPAAIPYPEPQTAFADNDVAASPPASDFESSTLDQPMAPPPSFNGGDGFAQQPTYVPETSAMQTSFEGSADGLEPLAAPASNEAPPEAPPMPMHETSEFANNDFSSAPAMNDYPSPPAAGSSATIRVTENNAPRDTFVPQGTVPPSQDMGFASPAPPAQPSYGAPSPAYGNTPSYDTPPPTTPLANRPLPSAQPSPMNDPYLSSGSAAPLMPQNSSPVGSGKPGPTELEGPQNPTLTVAKKSPKEVQLGMPAKFEIVIRNTGSVEAHDVVVRDQIPHGTELISTNPPANRSGDGTLAWPMGSLRPGAEVIVSMEVRPIEEGDVGSVANVTFQAEASSRTLVTRPQLVLEHTSPREVLVGEDVIFNIKLTNTGSGAATNVVIEEDVPTGLQHYDGNRLEYPIGMLRPDESRILELKLKADQAGMVENILFARADGSVITEDRCQLEIVSPQIQVEIAGPRRRFLERKANYEIHVANPGTAAAHNVELVARLPRNLKFVNTNNAGRYDSQRHQVIWNLAELPPQEMGTVSLETTPIQIGDDQIQVDVRASMGLADSVEHSVSIDGLAALLYTVTDVSDPIEVGGQTTYEIHIVNQGSKAATNLQIAALIPAGMELINGEGPSRANIDGTRVVFEPLPRLAPQADTFYKIHVKGLQPGDKRITVQLISDEVNDPVTKEESTHVYADE